MITKYELHLAYVLHTRAFRETSLLVDVLSKDHGLVTMVARGAKRGKSKISAILQPFTPLEFSWVGGGELVTLTHVEPAGVAQVLQTKRAICGLYINELTYKLLHKWDPCIHLFNCYQQVLQDLACADKPEQISLRIFEKALLKALGYGLQLTVDIDTGAPVQENQYYVFDPVLGPRLVLRANVAAIKGASLLALDSECFSNLEVLADIKRLMRSVLAYHLGTKTIVTRQLL